MQRILFALVPALILLPTAPAGATPGPICGDVNATDSVTSTDALLVLKNAVGQSVTLNCSGYDNEVSFWHTDYDTCSSELSTCESAPVCGNSIIEKPEDCEAGNLNKNTCVTLGFLGGTLACGAGCTFDTHGCYGQRFDASGPTVIDHHTGLEWEKKNGDDGTADFTNPNDVDNYYTWSNSGVPPDGGAFTNFLAALNGGYSPDGASTTGCYAGHCDWRIPTIDELLTIAGTSCGVSPCVADPAFLPVGQDGNWSSTMFQGAAIGAWLVSFSDGAEYPYYKTSFYYVRAVRTVSAGRDCPGFFYDSSCWLLGAAGDSCDTTCGNASLFYDGATEGITGSSGTDATCQAVLDGLQAPGSGLPYSSANCGAGQELGCADIAGSRGRCATPPTTSVANVAGYQRVCACH